MHIQSTGISCGVKRLIIGAKEKPTQEKLQAAISGAYCAIIMTSVPTKRKDVISLLTKNRFKKVESVKGNTFLVRHAKKSENPPRTTYYIY